MIGLVIQFALFWIFPPLVIGVEGAIIPTAHANNSNNSSNANNLNIDNPLGTDSFVDLFVGIANWVAGIVATLAVIVIVFGGIQYLLSGGNEEKITQANKTIQWAIIGLIVVVLSWSLLKTVLTILGVTVN